MGYADSWVAGLGSSGGTVPAAYGVAWRPSGISVIGGGYRSKFAGAGLGFGGRIAQAAPQDTGLLGDKIPSVYRLGLPFSTTDPAQQRAPRPGQPDLQVHPTIRQNTRGDWLGSVDAALQAGVGRPDFSSGWRGGELNLGNVVPWIMERFPVVVNKAVESMGVPKTPGGIDLNPLDALMGGVKAISDVAMPVLDAIPNALRDNTLQARAELYRDLVTGRAPDLVTNLRGALSQLVGWIPGMGGTGMPSYVYARSVLAQADPHGTMSPQDRAALLAAIVDLPQSVKDGLAKNPNADIGKLLDAAPEGRQWSYLPGIQGVVSNLAPNAILYGGEMLAGGGLGALAKGAALGVPALVPVANAAGQAWSGAALLTKASMAAGLGTVGLTTAGDAIARVFGNQAAQNFYEEAFKTHPISDIPSVQFVTSFAVDPGVAVGLLKQGIIRPVYGGADILISKATGKRLAEFFATPDPTLRIIANAFRESPEWVQSHLIGPDKPFPTMGSAQSAVLNWAADTLIRQMPDEQRIALGLANAGDWEGMHRALLQQQTRALHDLMTKNPDEISRTIYDTAWGYHQYRGAFIPGVAASNLADYMAAQNTYTYLRHKYDLVPGYKELVTPESREAIRAQLDARYPNPTDKVPDSFLNATIEKNPALRTMWQAIATPGQEMTRAEFDSMLRSAAVQWDTAMGRDPRATLTGRPTILEPGYSERDLAEALGTDVGTVKDLLGDSPLDSSRVRAFLEQKTGISHDEAMALTPAEVYNRAADYVEKGTRPWIDLGEQVAQQRARLPELQRQMANADVVGDAEARDRLAKEYAAITRLLHDAGDPQTPYVEQMASAVKRAKYAEWASRAEAHARAVEKLDAINAIDEQAASMDHIGGARVVAPARTVRAQTRDAAGNVVVGQRTIPARMSSNILDNLRPTRNGGYGWAGNTAPITDALFARLERFYRETGRAAQANGLSDLGDEELWNRIREASGAVQFMRGMTRSTKDYLAKNMPRGGGSSLDDYAGAYSRATGQNISAEAFLEQLASLNARRDEILSGTRLYDLKRTANVELPKGVEADLAFNVDPEWELHVHPGNVTALREAITSATPDPSTIHSILNDDPLLHSQAYDLARQQGVSVDELILKHPQALEAIAPEPVRPVPTDLDQAIMGGDARLMKDIVAEMGGSRAMDNAKPPIPDVPIATAEALAKQVRLRLSNRLRREFLDAGGDVGDAPSAVIMHRPENRQALQVLSLLNRGIPDTDVATIDGLLALQHETELGNASSMGIGLALQADAQRLVRELMTKAISDAKARGLAGYAKSGWHPAIMAEDDLALAKRIVAGDIPGVEVSWGPGQEDLAYGLARRKENAVVLEFQNVPGLAEEWFAGQFAPFDQRVIGARVRQAFNFVFGPHTNQAIRFESYQHFINRASRLGADPKAAQAVWNHWDRFAKESHSLLGADYPLYASAKNIPTAVLNREADKALAEHYGLRIEGDGAPVNAGPNPNRHAWDAHRSVVRKGTFDWARLLHESTSTTIRVLADSGTPLGAALESVYGKVTKNWFTTTMYYAFRFGADLRYHAMNFLETYFLYGGRAALAPGSLDQELFGWTRERATKLAQESAFDTGYPLMRGRDKAMNDAFTKLQGGRLVSAMKGLLAEDPAPTEQALLEMAQTHPQLAALIRDSGEDPVTWLKTAHEYFQKVMTAHNLDEAISESIWSHPDVQATPALNEVWARLDEVNRNLWNDLRQAFFGNPDRSRIERVLNSYLLMWPISYSIKATRRWLMPLLLDNIGGLKTNALGAYALNDLMAYHNHKLATDPQYQDWMEKHKNELFLANQLFPITPDLGLSLSTPLRDALFGATKNVGEIGPVYTLTKVLPNVTGELYQDLGSIPGIGDALGLAVRFTGRKPKAPVSGHEPLDWGSFLH